MILTLLKNLLKICKKMKKNDTVHKELLNKVLEEIITQK